MLPNKLETIKDFPYTKELLLLNKILNKDNADNLRIVGGAVRNFLISKPIKDFDLSCKLVPEETEKILKENGIKSIPTGIKFGTITTLINGKSFEITATRKDIKNDGRHAVVEYTNDFSIDAKRRDFTFNALYLDFNGKIYDYFDGLTDLNKGIVRFIGNPEERIKEDYLRILRFFRFFCYYGIVMDNEAIKYIEKYREKLNLLSAERIRDEMYKIFSADYPVKTLQIMDNLGILKIIANFSNHNFKYLELFYSIRPYMDKKYLTVNLAIAMLLNSKDDLNKLRQMWKLSNKDYAEILKYLEHKQDLPYSDKDLAKLIFNNGKTIAIALMLLNSIMHNSLKDINKKIQIMDSMEVPNFTINGNDLKNIGSISPKDYGMVLQYARDYFVESSFKAGRDEILKAIERFQNEFKN